MMILSQTCANKTTRPRARGYPLAPNPARARSVEQTDTAATRQTNEHTKRPQKGSDDAPLSPNERSPADQTNQRIDEGNGSGADGPNRKEPQRTRKEGERRNRRSPRTKPGRPNATDGSTGKRRSGRLEPKGKERDRTGGKKRRTTKQTRAKTTTGRPHRHSRTAPGRRGASGGKRRDGRR